MIKMEDVTLAFDNGVTALEKISTEIKRGEFVFLVGPTGAGKSSFLRLVTREMTPSDGKVIVNGQELNRLHKKKLPFMRRKIGVIYRTSSYSTKRRFLKISPISWK